MRNIESHNMDSFPFFDILDRFSDISNEKFLNKVWQGLCFVIVMRLWSKWF